MNLGIEYWKGWTVTSWVPLPWRVLLVRWGPALVPGLLMFVVALVGAGYPVLSWDEIATADVASRPTGQIWRLIQGVDGVFAPYYLFMHGWTAVFGTTDIVLRLPSILAMSGAVALTGEVGRRFFGSLSGALAGLLLCLMPNTSRYAAEARPYAFACLFAVLAVLLLDRAVHRPSFRRWLGYGIAVLLLGLSHVIAMATLGAHVVVLLRCRRQPCFRRTVISWLLSAGPALVALTPILWLGVHQRDTQLSWVEPLTAGGLWTFPGMVVGSVPAGWLLLGLALFAVRRPIHRIGETAALGLTPIAVVALVSLLVEPYWVVRYLLVVLAPLALLAAVGLLAAGERRIVGLRTTAVFVLLICAVYPGQRSVRSPHAKNGSDYRTAARIVTASQQPGDGIIFTPHSRTMRAGLDHYLGDEPGRPVDVLLARSAADAGSLRAEEHPASADRLRGTNRLWVLLYGTRSDPAARRRDLRPLLLAQYSQLRTWHLDGATLALFERRDTDR